jgi:hypothetical protein
LRGHVSSSSKLPNDSIFNLCPGSEARHFEISSFNSTGKRTTSGAEKEGQSVLKRRDSHSAENEGRTRRRRRRRRRLGVACAPPPDQFARTCLESL